jgi:hypothetical protein
MVLYGYLKVLKIKIFFFKFIDKLEKYIFFYLTNLKNFKKNLIL